MKCANCGAEIRVGCVYCPVCGKEAQIVSDYNILEDDYLDSLLQEGEKPSVPSKSKQKEKAAKPKQEKPTGKKSFVCGSVRTDRRDFVCKKPFL